MTPFATVYDYIARYGDVDDEGRVATLLGDATAFVLAQGVEVDEGDETQEANLLRVTCAVVHRALSAGDLAGISSYSEGAVGYTASVSLANPSEDFYITAAEKAALGIGAGRVGTASPWVGLT